MSAIDVTTVRSDDYAVACRFIKSRMPACLRAGFDPEDFVSDAVVELLQKGTRFSGRGPTLLIVVAKRRMIDAARSPGRRLSPFIKDLIDRQSSAELHHDAAELRERMLDRAGKRAAELARRSPLPRATLAEIAERTGLGLRTVQRVFKKFTAANEPY